MSLKKKVLVGLGLAGWLSSSLAVVEILSETPVAKRAPFEKTLGRRLALAASGPIFWLSVGPLTAVGNTVDLFKNPKKAVSELRSDFKVFMTDPPPKKR
jgi:hypothetical protein